MAGVGHDVEGEVERATPNIFEFCALQLRIDLEHSLTQEIGAAADGAGGFREEGGAASKEHAAVGREAVVVQIIFGIVDHAIVGA